MLMTPNDLIEELALRGYDMTPRRLVDWRQKELLPPLVQRGRGQGRGWVNGWKDARVVEQAIAVQELLWIHERTDWLYVPLWCLGFDVPLARVKPQFLTKLARQRTFLTGGAEDPEDLGDTISELAFHEATRPGPRTSKRLSPDLLEFVISLLVGVTEYTPDFDALRELAVEIERYRGSNDGAKAPQLRRLDERWPAMLRLVRRWVHRYASLARLEEAAIAATDAEWEAVHTDWRTLHELIASIRDSVPSDRQETLGDLALRGSAIGGPWLTLVCLSLRRSGQGQAYDATKREVFSWLTYLEHHPTILADEAPASQPPDSSATPERTPSDGPRNWQ